MNLELLEEETELIDPVEAQREEWMAKRHGKITCSRFGDLMGNSRSKDEIFTKTALDYLNLVVAERLGSWHSINASSLAWGTDNEPKAIDAYRERTGLDVDASPFNFHQISDSVGGTPDGLVGDDGCIEVKCPWNPSVHVDTMLSGCVPSSYVWQVHGHLLVTNRKWCDFISFDPRVNDPRLQLCIIRVYRNEPMLQSLMNRLMEAVEYVSRNVRVIQSTYGASCPQ